MIEREVFQRKSIIFNRLEKFGFIRINGDYIYERKIYDDMIARVRVSSLGEVAGEVYDEETGEIYVNYRIEDAAGSFVVGVRNAYIALLEEIAQAVCEEKRYIGDQTNLIDAYIAQKYGVLPEFMWKKFPHFGVYRNASTRKWFAIIMNIGKGKVVKGESGEVEVMNLKLDERAAEYLGVGVYPSYHMNHKSWVTVLLDGSVEDAVIKEMLEISYINSFNKTRRK